jgi:DNA-binding MarR family transcriptional regulator
LFYNKIYSILSNEHKCEVRHKSESYKSNLTTDEKVLMAIVRAGEFYKRMVTSMFKKHGFSFPQYNILRVLDASKNGQSKITNVSRIMLVPAANMTGLAKRLEKGGFIVRKSDPYDERATILEITEKGKATLFNIEQDRDECLHMMLSGFSVEEKLELLEKAKGLMRAGQ